MNLKDFLAKRDNPPELFWSVVIEEAMTQSGIWHIENETSVVDAIGSTSSYFNDDDLLEATDGTLSSAMQKLPDDSVEPKKTVFGVPSSWVSGGEIKDEYLGRIKKICDELGLTPAGFVVISEAIAHLYKSEEGVPLSAIVIGLGATSLEISVFKLGNLLGNATVARSVSLYDDVIEGLTRFEGASPLPSRFVVYDGREGDLDEAKDELMRNNWDDQEKIKFLHTPKAEVLNADRKILAVSLAGASEMAENISKVSLREMSEVSPEVVNVEPVEENVELKDLGFAVNEDVTTNEVSEEPPVAPVHTPPKVSHKITMPKMPKLSLPKINFSVAPLFVVFILILIGLIASFYFLPKASVSIAVTPKSFESNFDIAFDKNNSQVLTTKENGTKTKSTTGSKVVGDKAKGSVEIANGNASSIKLTAGTLLTSSSGLKFVTTQEASISGQVLPGSPGTATVDISAGDIGSQYNLSKGEVFSVGNYAKSLVAGTSKSDFSGGSSREISAVSKDDRDKLEKELQEELTNNAKEELTQQISSDQVLASDFFVVTVTNEDFDHKVGDEAGNLKLDLDVSVKALAVDRQKLFDFAKDKLSGLAPSGFVLRSDQIVYSFTFVDQKDDSWNFKVGVKANYLPSVNIDEIEKQISGKTISAATSYLKTMPGFRGAQIKFNNNIFGSLNILPFIKNHIEVEIGAEK